MIGYGSFPKKRTPTETPNAVFLIMEPSRRCPSFHNIGNPPTFAATTYWGGRAMTQVQGSGLGTLGPNPYRARGHAQVAGLEMVGY